MVAAGPMARLLVLAALLMCVLHCSHTCTQVHDLDGRLQQVAALLRRHGFDSVVWEQDAELAGSTLYNLWATRRSRSEGNKQA